MALTAANPIYNTLEQEQMCNLTIIVSVRFSAFTYEFVLTLVVKLATNKAIQHKNTPIHIRILRDLGYRARKGYKTNPLVQAMRNFV